MIVSRRWWNSFPFFLALLVLIVIGWSAMQAFSYPHDGIIYITQTGVIKELDD